MTSHIPTDDEFDRWMIEIDRELIHAGLDIPKRPIHAMLAVGRRVGLPLPFAKPPASMGRAFAEGWLLSEKINRWYEARYGDRLKVDFSLGRMALIIEGDLWVMRFPRIVGSAVIVALRTTVARKAGEAGPVLCNVVELLEDISPARIQNLAQPALDHILGSFYLGFQAANILEASGKHELICHARGDISVAISHLVASRPLFGASKWASLQAAEKMLKAAIALTGARYSQTHDLETLTKEAHAAGIKGDWSALAADIQCRPGIRYGQGTCTRDEAVAAHRASFALVNALHEGGAAFQAVNGFAT